ncbi:MAG TPA: hypothetical protein PLF26_04155 [Blastocatellia bacterium]|nr:hypothetical protein [Blastocatellia bacterium]
MTYNIDLYLPSALHGAAPMTESLGRCRVISRNVFVTVTEHNGNAHVIALDDVVELDRTVPRFTTITGRTFLPRHIDLPDKIFVETPGGYARTIIGDQVARLMAVRQR